jgi:hypothetical protein
MQRVLAVLALALSLTAARALGADVEFVRVWPAWRDASSFEHISEYFTGKEDTGGQVLLRTHPEERAGFYFLVRVANTGPVLAGAKFTLQLIAPTSVETKTYTFPADVAAHRIVFLLGLTGADWTDRKAHPVAWKLTLDSGDGRPLASAQSFLWEKPVKP